VRRALNTGPQSIAAQMVAELPLKIDHEVSLPYQGTSCSGAVPALTHAPNAPTASIT
jgi:hypothetical protein